MITDPTGMPRAFDAEEMGRIVAELG